MRANFILFFTIFFTIYGLANLYIFVRGFQSIPQDSSHRTLYVVLFLILSLSFIGGRLLENRWMSSLSDTLVWIGSFWFAAMLYFLLALLILDLLRLVNHWFPFFPVSISNHYDLAKRYAALTVLGVTTLLLLVGHLNALTPRIQRLDIAIPKRVGHLETLRLAVASDIHLGTLMGRKRFDQIVAKINALRPDLILLPGDIVDEDLAPVIKQNLGESLRNLKAKFGVFATTGNHEYIGGVEEACRYLEEHGVVVLRDKTVRLNGAISLMGREDRSIMRFTGKARKPLSDLMASVDQSDLVLLMDHQPFHLEEAEQNGADIQISGHTHHGQLWPLNFITGQVYELDWGYRKKGQTHVYVSCGVGTWGPPVRLGSRPEIVSLQITFSQAGK